MANTNIVKFVDNLDNAIRELRNRRFIEEADAVKLAKEIVIPLMLEIREREAAINAGDTNN